MVDLKIKYPLWLFGQQTHKCQVPASWNELTSVQLSRVAALLFSGQKDISFLRIKLLRVLMGLKWHHLFLIGGERLIDLFPFIKFIEEEISLTDNKVTFIDVDKNRFFGPAGNFSTLSAEEWTDADEAYMDFRQSNETKDLDRLVATLYRKRVPGMWPRHPQWNGDYREPYNEYAVPWVTIAMAKVDINIKLAVFLWYQGCRREWEEIFERVFKAKEELGPQSFGWQETMLKLSGAEFGDLKKTQHTYMYKLMLKMEVTLKDEEYRKEQEKAQRNAH
jgi:hypothetical protein